MSSPSETRSAADRFRHFEFVINAAGGGWNDAVEKALRDEIARHSLDAKVRLSGNGSELKDCLQQALASDAETIVACGGDGTVSYIAAEAARAGKRLGVLPLGTLNNFSKDLGLPQDLAGAVAVIAAGRTIEIDLGEVNGRAFINNSSIGLYPRIVRKRVQQQRLGYGKWWAAAWATVRMFRFSRFLRVKIELDGKAFLRKTPFVFVGNNEYEMDLYNIGRRPALNQGKLSLYFLHRGGRWGVIMLLWHTLTGRVKQWRDFEQVMTDSITIQTRRKRMPVAFDGEVSILDTPLNYKILPKALKVIVPEDRTIGPADAA